jgi:flavodoxin
MKTLVVYYSRTGNTRKVGLEIAKELDAEVEEIKETKNREGALGYLLAGRDALLSRPASIQQPSKDPALYDLVVVGTPVWAFKASPPVCAYLRQNKGRFRSMAFYLTCGDKAGSAFKDMQSESGMTPLALLEVKEREMKDRVYHEKIADYARTLSKNPA